MQLSNYICQKIYDNVVKRNIQLGSTLADNIKTSKRIVVIGMMDTGTILYGKDKRTNRLELIDIDRLTNYRVVRSKVLSKDELKAYGDYESAQEIFLNYVSYAEFIVKLKVGSLIAFEDANKPQIVLSTNPILVFLCDPRCIPKENEIELFFERNSSLIKSSLILSESMEYYGSKAKIVKQYDSKVMEKVILKLKLMYGDLNRYAFNY